MLPVRVLDYAAWEILGAGGALAFALDPDGNPATADGADVINLSLSTLRETELIKSLLEKACGGSSDELDFPVSFNPRLI